MGLVDIAIIGSGPAGISAAITAKMRGKRILLLGNRSLSDKVCKAHRIGNYPGLPDIAGADFAQALQAHLSAMDIQVTEAQVSAVYAAGTFYGIQTPTQLLEAKTVILATGVSAEKTLPGETALLGRGVSYCATCDAQFFRGKTVAVLGYGEDAAAEADFLAETSARVLYFPMARGLSAPRCATCIRERPVAILGSAAVEVLQTEQASYPVDGVFLLRSAIAPERLIPGLNLEDGHAAVNLQMETNLPGCFACGDVAGRPYQYIKAAGQGNVAALSAVRYLDGLDCGKNRSDETPA